MKKIISITLAIVMLACILPIGVYAASVKAVLSPQKLEVDGQIIECEKYNIDGSNYFKLRDIAKVLNGTKGQFEVGYDNVANMISITTGKAYTTVGGELSQRGDFSSKTVASSQAIQINGKSVNNLSVYNIGGNNFFKLRDLGDSLGFFVDYSAATNTAIVSSDKHATAIPTDTTEKLSFASLLSESNATHEKKIIGSKSPTLDTVKPYLLHKPGEVTITAEEIKQLNNIDGEQKSQITNEEAQKDIDLFFRSFKYSYGPYYYFGGDTKFNAAKEEVLASIKGKSTVSTEDLSNALYESLVFINDGHLNIGYRYPSLDARNRWEYRYPSNNDTQKFYKDANGYYKLSGTKKNYFVSCDNKNVLLEKTLFSDGEIAYGLVQFGVVNTLHSSDTIVLSNGKEKVTWVESSCYPDPRSEADVCNAIKSGSIEYLEDRAATEAVPELGRVESKNLKMYQASAVDAKKAKVIIYDIRRNCGGTMWAYGTWLKNYIGELPNHTEVFTHYDNALSRSSLAPLGQEKYRTSTSKAKIYNNSVPIIVLVDGNVGSNGEGLLQRLSCFKNVIVIGSNTGGAQMNQVGEKRLPNSGIFYSMGSAFGFINDCDSTESKGYEPDVWCDPQYALDYAIKLIDYYGLANAGDTDTLKKNLKSQNIGLYRETIYFGIGKDRFTEGLGAYDGVREFDIYYGDQLVKDYTVSNSDNSIITVRKDASGKLIVTQVGNGYSTITITIGDNSQEFRFHGGE